MRNHSQNQDSYELVRSLVTLPKAHKPLPFHIIIFFMDSPPFQISACLPPIGANDQKLPVWGWLQYARSYILQPCCPWGNSPRGYTYHRYILQWGLFFNLVGIVFSHLINHIRISATIWLPLMNEIPNLSPCFLTTLGSYWLHLCFHNQKEIIPK